VAVAWVVEQLESAAGGGDVPRELTVQACSEGTDKQFRVTVRIDTPGEQGYYRNGGIMHYVLRSLL